MRTVFISWRHFVALLSATLCGANTAPGASIIVTAEAPGVQSSVVSGVTTMDFDATAPGIYTTLSSPIEVYSSPGLAILNPDELGGANQTRYMSVGAQSGQPSATLDLNSPQAYFGLYVGAGDSTNFIDFYSHDGLLASFDVSSIFPALENTGGPFGLGHFGNPNTGENRFQPYVYLNFIGTDGISFDRLVFHGLFLIGGFESDNHSVRSTQVTDPLPGTVVAMLPEDVIPEPPSIWLLSFGVAVLARRRLRAHTQTK